MVPDLRKVNLSEQLINAVIGMIESDEWEEGLKLPNEIDLAESFHVSRNVMREALKVLNSMGVLDSHTGRGTFVSIGAKENIIRKRFFEELKSDTAVEYALESRLVVEPELAALACKRSSDEDIAQLRRDVERSMDPAIDIKTVKFNFHLRIGELSGNPLLSNFLHSLISVLQDGIYSDITDKAADIDLITIHEHLKVVEAMEMRDAELVKYLMYCHLKRRVDVIKINAAVETDKLAKKKAEK